MVNDKYNDIEDKECVDDYMSLAQKEIGLTIKYDSFQKFEKALKGDAVTYTGLLTKKTRNLKKTEYIDFNPFDGGVKENVNITQNTILIRDILFLNSEKVLFRSVAGYNMFFRNCVFLGNIRFTGKTSSLYFDNCIANFMDFSKNTCKKLEIVSSLIKKLKLFDANCNELNASVCNSKIDNLEFIVFNGESVDFFGNSIMHIHVESCYHAPLMDYSNFICFSGNKIRYAKEKQIKNLVGFTSSLLAMHSSRLIETLNYVQQLNVISEDAGLCSTIEYLKNVVINRPFGKRVLLALLGYFMKPGRIIIESVVVITSFAFAYLVLNNCSFFSVKSIISSFELSLLSFVGNSDQTLSLFLRFINYFENLLGFLLMNAFTISLAKKYLK